VVADLRTLTHYGNRHNARVIGGPDELWLDLMEGQETGPGVISALAEQGLKVRDYRLSSELVQQRLDQPLTNASWGGLLVLMFLALVLASASGIVLFCYLDTRERQTEFALLRTLGSSRNQINGIVWFNLLVIVACGVGLGAWSGQQIGTSILPVLEVAEGGSRVTPPMVLQTSWGALLIAYLVLAGVTFGTVLWLAWFTTRMEIQQVLRAGEAIR
jgi:ABC-type antimicrobial peptide transport system permease subunit